MIKSASTISAALKSRSVLASRVKEGLNGLSRSHRLLLAEPDRTRISDSLDLDSALRQSAPADNRWDYLICIKDRKEIVGVEPHSARESELSVVIAKKRSAEVRLREEFAPGHAVAAWYWVTEGKNHFTKTERVTKVLAQSGIEFRGRLLRLPPPR